MQDLERVVINNMQILCLLDLPDKINFFCPLPCPPFASRHAKVTDVVAHII